MQMTPWMDSCAGDIEALSILASSSHIFTTSLALDRKPSSGYTTDLNSSPNMVASPLFVAYSANHARSLKRTSVEGFDARTCNGGRWCMCACVCKEVLHVCVANVRLNA